MTPKRVILGLPGSWEGPKGPKYPYFDPFWAYFGPILRGLLSGPGQAWPGPVLDYGPYGAILAQAWPGLARTAQKASQKEAQNRPILTPF